MLIRRAARLATMLAAALCCVTAIGASTIPAVVVQPRRVGHALGDIVEQRVLLEIDGRAVRPKVLPADARLGAWFERRPARIERDAEWRGWLVIDYQLINAPREVTSISLPSWQIIPEAGGPALRIPRWALSVGPLTPGARPTAAALRPDLLPPRWARPVWLATLGLASAALAVTALWWCAWWLWRARLSAERQPFARALHEMRGLDPREPRAWQALHRAFDRTAGRVVRPTTLSTLFEAAPHLAGSREVIEEFFARSNTLFFGASGGVDGVSPRALCERLRRLERRHER